MSIPKTKLRPPVLRVPIVPRARLTQSFIDRRPLTVISAPAGSGKTTLTLDWLMHTKSKVAWLSLDSDDNDPIRFMRGLLAALEIVKVKIRIPSGQRDIKAIITEIINQFDDAQSIALVLDDYHLVTTPTIHQALDYLLDHIPPSLQLVLVTREEPPLSLARLRARRQLREFGIDELRFTSEETKQFLHEAMGLNLSNEKIKTLERHTRGWIAGLQMAALSLQTNHEHDILNSDEHHFITEYLLGEVFNQQPQDVQTFLLTTSILDTFSPAICKAINPKNSQTILTRIEKSNLFITSSGGWYQYHPLFREFLLNQLQKDFPERVQELHKRACHCLSENGLTAQAIPHAIAIEDYETAAGFVATLAPETFQRGELITLRRWLDLLPDSAKWIHPRICLIQIWLLIDSNQRAEAQIYLDQMGEFLEHNLRGEYLAVRALYAAITHQTDLAFNYTQQAQATPEAKDPFIQMYVFFALGLAQMGSLKFFQAEQSLRTVLSLAESAGNSYIAISAISNLSDVQYLQARLSEAEKTCNAAIKEFTANSPDAHDWHWTLARSAFQKNNLDDALQLVNRAIDLCMEWNNSPTQHARALLQRAITYFALGDKVAAQADLDAADTISRSLEEIIILRSVIRQHVLFAVADGDLAGARRWLKMLSEYDEQPFPFYFAYAKGRVLLAEEKYKEANATFRTAIKQLSGLDFNLVLIDILIWQSISLHNLEDRPHAAQTLTEAINLARQGGVVRPFMEARDELLTIINQRSNGLERKDAAWVLDQINRSKKQVDVKEGSVIKGPALTRRERQILQLLALGLSNQEMAERLFIAEGTLKRHVANLYQKLGVHNRAQAIQHLNEL